MSMHNYPTVVLGKMFDRNQISEELYEELIDDVHEPLVAQYGESNFEKPCIGYVLGFIGPYSGDTELTLFTTGKEFDELKTKVYEHIVSISLPVKKNEIKLYLRDEWGQQCYATITRFTTNQNIGHNRPPGK